MIPEIFLTCALSLGGLSYRPTLGIPVGENTFKNLVAFLTQRTTPILTLEIKHNGILVVHNSGEHWTTGDYRQLPFPNAIFDVIVRHPEDLVAKGMKEISRTLKRGGFFVMYGYLHHELIKGFNFKLLPLKWENDYFVYRRNGYRKSKKVIGIDEPRTLEGSA